MTVQELQDCLHLLVGDGNFKTALATDITSDDFAENVLGFEEVEEIEEDEGDLNGQQAAMMGSYSQGLGGGLHNDVIPEEDV